MNFIISFFLGQQLAGNDFVVQNHIGFDFITQLADLPHIKRKLYYKSILFLVNFSGKKVTHDNFSYLQIY